VERLIVALSVFIHPSSWNKNSRKFVCRMLHIPAPTPPISPAPGTPHSPAPIPLVTPMDRYTELWMLAYYKLMFVVSREYPMSRPCYLKH
jgi:hypothetical protein